MFILENFPSFSVYSLSVPVYLNDDLFVQNGKNYDLEVLSQLIGAMLRAVHTYAALRVAALR